MAEEREGTAGRYKARAAAMLVEAEKAETPALRLYYVEMANCWRTLAEQAARNTPSVTVATLTRPEQGGDSLWNSGEP